MFRVRFALHRDGIFSFHLECKSALATVMSLYWTAIHLYQLITVNLNEESILIACLLHHRATNDGRKMKKKRLRIETNAIKDDT
jgi:hypothetical protein